MQGRLLSIAHQRIKGIMYVDVINVKDKWLSNQLKHLLVAAIWAYSIKKLISDLKIMFVCVFEVFSVTHR